MNAIKLSATLLLALTASLQAQPKCTTASLNGNLFYMISGSIKSGTAVVSYAELGQMVADGAGNFASGTTTTSTAGTFATGSVSGTYVVHADCSGTATLITSAQTYSLNIQVVDGGGLTLATITSSPLNEIGEMRLYRAGNVTGSQCGNGSITGSYGALLSGGTYSGGIRTPYESEIQFTFDGNGNITTLAGQVVSVSSNGSSGLSGGGTYSISSNCSGTAQLNLANTTQTNYLIARVEGGSILFLETDANTTVSGSANPQLLQSILPQFVFGAGTWYSALYFSNPTSGTVSFPVTFTSDSGTPLTVPGSGTTKQVTIAPNNTAIIEAQNTGTFGEGYATFALPAGVNGFGIFRQTVAGRPDQESTVGFKSATQTATSLIWDETNNFVDSVAIVNSSSVATTVTITVWDNAGNLIGTSMQSIPANSKVTSQLDQLQNLSGMVGKRGYALFSVAGGNVSVLGLRFGGVAFTAIPTTQVQ